jgi:hypothetical protein
VDAPFLPLAPVFQVSLDNFTSTKKTHGKSLRRESSGRGASYMSANKLNLELSCSSDEGARHVLGDRTTQRKIRSVGTNSIPPLVQATCIHIPAQLWLQWLGVSHCQLKSGKASLVSDVCLARRSRRSFAQIKKRSEGAGDTIGGLSPERRIINGNFTRRPVQKHLL